MSHPSARASAARIRGRLPRFAPLLAAAALVPACKPSEKTSQNPPPASTAPAVPAVDLAAQLAGARVDAAEIRLSLKRPDEALALLVSALRSDPASAEARELAGKILAETVWNFPTRTIRHGLPIQHIAFAAPSSLWVALGGEMNATVRWDLEKPAIEAVLFPAWKTDTHSLVLSPDARHAVIARGGANLLCDAATLKPIRDLGPVPEFLTPSAVVAFSPDGLLMAAPAFVSADDRSLVWHLRDTATGELLRSSDPEPADGPRPLAAFLTREKLRVLRADGSLMEMPVSPVEPAQTLPLPEPAELLAAQFSADGEAALVLRSQGPHEPSAQSIISYSDQDDGSLEIPRLRERFPWSRDPNFWNSVMTDAGTAPFAIAARTLEMTVEPHAPIVAGADISAAAFTGETVIIGDTAGDLTSHRLLPLPKVSQPSAAPSAAKPAGLAAFEKLCESLAGQRYDETAREFLPLEPADRAAAFAACDFAALGEMFPALDFAPLAAVFAQIQPGTVAPDSLLPLWKRLARADLSRKSWPEILRLSKDLAGTDWHRQLTEEVVSRKSAAADAMAAVFASKDGASVLAAIADAGKSGPAAAAALACALASDQPEWIEACLAQAENLPPVLRQIALSRIAWLRGRKPASLSPWPENFPTMAEIRQRQDWDGWEQADFSPALEAIRKNIEEELVALEVPADSTAEQRKEIAARLADPATVGAIGKPRFAIACMKAATAFSAFPEEAETTAKIAQAARDLGAPPEPCMRAEATALTARGKYPEARDLWVELITEHPLETLQPGDYAEAAYTAFENSDPQQAMTILTTGTHRYPNDAHFALRAGWVALLTGNAQRGYEFLQAGRRIGYAPDRVENATALLAIAAAQSGAWDDATVYYNDLVRIDPAWLRPATLETLDWPEELKNTLLQFMH
jgi:tetratricopeptide (TPR) repeat protein